jgi:hypothetical protein
MIKLRKTNLLNFFLILAALGCTREKQSNRLFQSYSTLTCEQLLETKKNLAATDARFQKMYFEPLQFLVAELNKVSQPLPGLRQCYRQHLELLLASKSVQQTSDQFSQEQKLQLSKAIVLVVDAISVTNRQGPFHSFEQILTNEKTYEDFARLSVPLKLDAFKNLLQTYPQFAESPLLTQLSHHIIEFNELSIYEPYSGIKELVTRSNVTSSPNAQVAMLRLVTLTLVRNGFLFTERGRLQGIKKLERIMKSTEQNLRNAPANSQAASTAALMLANFKKIRENVLNSPHSFARLENELKAAYVDLGVPNAAQLVTDALAEARLAVHEGLPYGVARIQEGDIWMQTSEGGAWRHAFVTGWNSQRLYSQWICCIGIHRRLSNLFYS